MHRIEYTHWDLVGYLGNLIFGSRFLLQWYVSEKKKLSVIPTAFWWLSLVGTVILAVYFIGTGSGPGIIGSAPNGLIYMRNLQLIRKQRLASRASPGTNTELHAPQDPHSPA